MLLESKGCEFWIPAKDGPHLFDMWIYDPTVEIYGPADVKTKPARRYYPDTGMDLYWVSMYQKAQDETHCPFKVFFVDMDSASIYGGYIDDLNKPLVLKHNGKTLVYPIISKSTPYNGPTNLISYSTKYWPLENMTEFGKIHPEQVAQLRVLSKRNSKYA